jgi:hypothetical protein
MRFLMLTASFLLPALLAAQAPFTADTTPTWEQVIARYEALDRAHQGAQLTTFGHDDGGQPLHLFILADGSGFSPDSIRAAGKAILWITNGIHPGEPDGIDASLMLARGLLENDQLMGLLARVAVCIVPVYNVGGALQRGSHSRANQDGPEAYGFRGNARNLDLNRDFIKADAENTRSLHRALARWDPDIYFETHVSDGADHRYVMELLTTQKDKLDPGLSAFMHGTFVPGLYAWMDRKGMAMCPYFETVGERPEDGLFGFNDGPRYSTGYNALLDRIGILSESHMLKPYADRVNATLQLMLATLAGMNAHADALRKARTEARARTAAAQELGMNWELDTTVVQQLPWKGWATERRPSAVSALPRLWYDHQRPVDTVVPWMVTYRPALTRPKPAGYLVPHAWRDIALALEQQGVRVEAVRPGERLTVEEDSIGAFRTGQQPYEGHYLHRGIQCTSRRRVHIAQEGDLLIRTGRATDRLVMEALEPQGEDSYFAWGFFDSVLQQKEWFSDYVFEDLAADLLRRDSALYDALEARRAADPTFAADAWAQLYFIYQRSPWFEPTFRKYPVLRIVGQ